MRYHGDSNVYTRSSERECTPPFGRSLCRLLLHHTHRVTRRSCCVPHCPAEGRRWWIYLPGNHHGLHISPPRPLVLRMYQGLYQACRDPETSARHQDRQPKIRARTSQHANPVQPDVTLVYVRAPFVHSIKAPRFPSRRDASSLGSAWAVESQWSVERGTAPGSSGAPSSRASLRVRRVGEPSAHGATCRYGRWT